MTIKSLYPNVRASLNLDFANAKQLDPRVTFTRASTATFVGSDGVIQTAASGRARLTYDPATGESLGLLVEEARTNNALNSDLTTWTLGAELARTTETSLVGPFSQSPVFTVTGSATSTAFLSNTGVTLSTNDMVSVFVKLKAVPSGNPIVHFRIGTSGQSANLNLSTLALSANNASWSGAGYQSYGNGWYRFYATYISTNTTSFRIYLTVGGPTGIAAYITGLQIEAGTFLTSYIPTSGSTVTRAADVATLSNTSSSVFPTSAFTTVNSPFGTAGGSSTLKLVGPAVARVTVYSGDLTQAQINALAGVNDNFWRWRVLGSTFALPTFTTDGSVTVDWGDGTVQTLTTGVYTFTNGGGYHDIGFRLNSGTYFKPNIANNATYKDRVIAIGPAPASMKVDGNAGLYGCANLRGIDGYADYTGSTNLTDAWRNCSSLASFPLIATNTVTDLSRAWESCTGLTSFPLINTAAGTNFQSAWFSCSSLTSFPLINTAAGTSFVDAWRFCSSLTSFPLINTAAGTNFSAAWDTCSSLTTFPLINTAAGTNFFSAWDVCTSLTSFPLINTAAGTNFGEAWRGCSSLTSFPALSFASATNFNGTWQNSTSLTSFPANMFNTTGTLVATAFSGAFQNCALTAASIENILTSLVTNGQSNITLNLNAGTNAGAATWTTAANTAYATLITRGWTITRNA